MSVLQEMQNLGSTILVGGDYVKSASTSGLDVIDPSTEQVIAEIAETSSQEIDDAVSAAHAAQKIWWRKSALERAEIMHDIANDLHSMKARLGEALTREMGKPYKESRMKWIGRFRLFDTMQKLGVVMLVV